MADLSINVTWHKSSHSGGGANCVEVALLPEVTAVRDSKNPDGPRLTFGAPGWASLHRSVELHRFRP